MLTPRLRKALHWFGIGLSLFGVAFVGLTVVENFDRIALSNLSYASWLALLLLAIAYGLSGILLALAWRALLRHYQVEVSARWAIWAYGTSQLAKYVPGNIVHLAGRQAIGASAGLPGWPLVKSTLWEFGTIALTGGLFAALALPLMLRELSPWDASLLFVLLLLGAVWTTQRTLGPEIARAIVYYALFLTLSGAIFVGALVQVLPQPTPPVGTFAPVAGAFVVAWLTGFLTPGAPAGVGVREVVLYGLLQAQISQSDLIAAVLLGRFVTVVGDCLFYFFALSFVTKLSTTS